MNFASCSAAHPFFSPDPESPHIILSIHILGQKRKNWGEASHLHGAEGEGAYCSLDLLAGKAADGPATNPPAAEIAERPE
jgi:hypothetical protein